jgi:hypothetical protein
MLLAVDEADVEEAALAVEGAGVEEPGVVVEDAAAANQPGRLARP